MIKHVQDNMNYSVRIKLYYVDGFEQMHITDHHLFKKNLKML